MQKPVTVNIPFPTIEDATKFFSSKYISAEDHTKKLANQKTSLNGLGATDTDFLQMLETDKKTYLFIVQYRPYFIEIHKELSRLYPLSAVGTPRRETVVNARTKFLTDTGYFRYKEIYNKYNARQTDYRTNKANSLANKLNAWSASIVTKAQTYWNSFSDSIGLGVVPLAVPVVVVAGTVLSITVLAYFVYKYKTEISLDSKNAIKLAAEIAKTNPKLANKILNKAFDLQESRDTSALDSVGEGAKTFLQVAGASIGLFALYKVGNEVYKNHFLNRRKTRKRN